MSVVHFLLQPGKVRSRAAQALASLIPQKPSTLVFETMRLIILELAK